MRLGGDAGELRPWHYIYEYSIGSRLIRRVKQVGGRQDVRTLPLSDRLENYEDTDANAMAVNAKLATLDF